MTSSRVGVFALVLSCCCLSSAAPPDTSSTLRVCADPDNLPYSNDELEGFENRIAEIVAADMGARVEYTWWPQRQGFLRNTLHTGKCDVVLGLPTMMRTALTTTPYYRSVYSFVTRPERDLDISSFDDERLRTLRVGVQLVGDDGANAPPAHWLSRRGIIQNVVGFPVYRDPARIVRAVAQGDVDIAAVWGPVAGYYAARQQPPLRVVPAASQVDSAFPPLAFDMSMAVRTGDTLLRDRLERILHRRRSDLHAILARYHVPAVGREGS